MKCGQKKMVESEVARMLAVYAETTLSTVAIGNMFGRDHSTVSYHIVKHGVKRGMIVTTRVFHAVRHELAPVPAAPSEPEPVKDYAYYIRQAERRKAAGRSKSFPADLCISQKKRKIPSDIIDRAVEVIV